MKGYKHGLYYGADPGWWLTSLAPSVSVVARDGAGTSAVTDARGFTAVDSTGTRTGKPTPVGGTCRTNTDTDLQRRPRRRILSRSSRNTFPSFARAAPTRRAR